MGNRIIASLFICFFIFGFCHSTSFAKMELRVSSEVSANFNESQMLKKFIELVKEYSNGEIVITPYWSNQLGTGKECFEATALGLQDLAMGSYSNLSTLTDAFEVFQLPFIFQSREQYFQAHTSAEVRAYIDKKLQKIGLKWIAFAETSPRQILTTKKIVKSPSDMNGLKFRASRSPLEIAMINSFGAEANTIDWAEALDALRTGVVDGMTVDAGVPYRAKVHDIIRNVGILNAASFGHVVVVGVNWWNRLDKETKDLFVKAASEAEKYLYEIAYDAYNNDIKKGKELGVKYYGYSNDERQAFMALAKKSWKQFEKTSCPPELVELVIKEAGPAGDPNWGLVY